MLSSTNINTDSTIKGSGDDNINMDSTITVSVKDNINMDSTIKHGQYNNRVGE
jgi:hypothetical protein